MKHTSHEANNAVKVTTDRISPPQEACVIPLRNCPCCGTYIPFHEHAERTGDCVKGTLLRFHFGFYITIFKTRKTCALNGLWLKDILPGSSAWGFKFSQTATTKFAISWNATPCRLVHTYQRFGEIWCLSTLKVEAAGYSEIFVPTYDTTRCRIPQDSNPKMAY